MKAQCVRDRKKNSIFIHNMKKEKPGPGGGFIRKEGVREKKKKSLFKN